jgi:hypothetical protein
MPDTISPYGLLLQDHTVYHIDPQTEQPLGPGMDLHSTDPNVTMPGPYFHQTLPPGWTPPEPSPEDQLASLQKGAASMDQTAETDRAILNAERLIATRGLARDVKSGVPPEVALATWGKFIYGQGRDLAAVMKAAAPRPNYQFVPGDEQMPATYQAPGKPPVLVPRSTLPQPAVQGGPVQARPVLDPSTGKPIPGMIATPGASGNMVTHLVPSRRTQVALSRVAALEKEWGSAMLASGDDSGIASPTRKKAFQQAKSEYDRYQGVIADAMGDDSIPIKRSGVPAGGQKPGIPFRSKKTGRIYYYHGSGDPHSDTDPSHWTE